MKQKAKTSGIFSRRQIDDIFFSRKQDLTFQIVSSADSLHEMSKSVLREKISKQKKKKIKISSAENFTQSTKH